MNSFGRIFRINIFGESHGPEVGVTIDGCPPGIPLSEKDFETDLARRKSGARGTTPRKESDIPRLISGVYQGRTTGAPLTILFKNSDTRPGDYADFTDIPRPGHADFTATKKYSGFNDPRGGGHFSGRITIGLVAAGVIARKIITPVEVKAGLKEAGGEREIEHAVEKAIAANDSIGGIVECKVSKMPVGLGEPFFDSLESLISHMVFSIPGIKGVEFGAGFDSARMKGSEHNDSLISVDGRTKTNHSGGINGGISNGNPLVFRVAVKPTSSISKKQRTINMTTGKMVDLEIKGRHDVCIALRVPVIVEAATAIVLADLFCLTTSNQI
ncbi:MAG: chorismate synthase [Bacteroidetes bacterium]|nr:chorismate synthase [Bacteroidota bacterium]